MTTLLTRMMITMPVLATTVALAAGTFDLRFDEGVDNWRIVVDGVMGGRSSGRVSQPEPGILRFTGDLSLENNGGFSQMRTNVDGSQFAGAEGVEIKIRGDGRVYKFDIRCSNVRMMAGAFQRDFQSEDGVWTTLRIPFDEFRLYSFGRRVADAPALDPSRIEAIGVTLADKKPGPFRLEVESISAFGGAASSAGETGGSDLVSVAKAAGLNTLLDLVAAAELELPAGERVTILAPTDEAFAALPPALVEELLRPESRATLRSVLTYHVAGAPLSSSELLSRRSIQTLNGQRLAIDTTGPIAIGGSGVVAVDVPFDGGVVHVIDTVLMPELKSIADLAAGTSQLSTLAAAVSAAGLGDQLGAENGPWTVFAPVDSAFASLPPGALDELLEPANRSRLVDVLALHVVPGRLYANELLANRRALTLLGDPIEFGLDGGRLQVGGATIVTANIEASNGVVHLIDNVILDTSEPETISATLSAEAARLFELAISRGAPLYNAGQIGACAAIYELTIESVVALGARDLGRDVVQRLERSLVEAAAEHDWAERAWAYRRAIDDVYTRLLRQSGPGDVTAAR